MRNSAELATMQADALYSLTANVFMNLIGASVCAYAYWSPATSAGLKAWMAALVVQSVIWMFISEVRRRNWRPGVRSETWRSAYVAFMGFGGVMWGVAGMWLLPLGTPDQALVMSLMAMGAVVSTFPVVVYPPSHIAFQLPLFFLSAFGFAASSNPYGMFIAGMSVILALALIHIASNMGSVMIRSMRLAIENASLADKQKEQAIALEQANAELQRLSYLDPLTGLANRRSLMSELRGRGRAKGSALLVIDVDHFKRYNDSFGHAAGDACLQDVAGVLTRHAQAAGGLAVRQGGEEFCIVLGPMPGADALALAESVRMEIGVLHQMPDSRLERPITDSIGYAMREAEMADDAFMHAADTAVYRAKNAGRDCVRGPEVEARPELLAS